MRKISTSSIIARSQFVPIIIGTACIFYVIFFFGESQKFAFKLWMLGCGIFLIIWGLYYIKHVVYEVYDCGDYLLVKKNRIQKLVYFSDILDITGSSRFGIQIRLNRECKPFGRTIIYFSHLLAFPYRGVDEELLDRVQNAKQKKMKH